MDLHAPAAPLALSRPQSEQVLPLTPALALAPKAPDAAKIEQTAREFESLFAKMLISSMRQASFGDPLFPSENTTFRDLHDQHLAKQLSAGPGLGLAPVIARQLSGPEQPTMGRSPSAAEAMDGLERPDATSEDPGESAVLRPLGSYHRPARMQTPAWLSPDAQQPLLANGHFDLARGTGPDLPAQASGLPEDSFVLTPPIPTGPAPSDPSTIRGDSPDNFVASIWPQAQRAAQELGVDPKMLVAQAALETGWGRHVVGRQKDGSGGNLFGIKAGRRWSGRAVTVGTNEFVGGQSVRQSAAFRAYGSVEASFDDYIALLKNNGRYAECLGCGEDQQKFASALSRAGYATDPHYARKLVAIADGPTLRRALGRLNPGPLAAANAVAPPVLGTQMSPALGRSPSAAQAMDGRERPAES